MVLEELSKLSSSEKSTIIINKGISPLALLGVAFIVMRVMEFITWSWWWVLAPFWIPFCLALLVVIGLIVFILCTTKKLNKELDELTTSNDTKEEDEKVISELKKETKDSTKKESKKPVSKSSKKSKKDSNELDNGKRKSKGKNV